MFLDEKLEQIYFANEGEDKGECCERLIKACWDGFGDPHEIGLRTWLNNIKQVESSWRIFAKRHPEIDPDGFREILREADKNGALFKALGWE